MKQRRIRLKTNFKRNAYVGCRFAVPQTPRDAELVIARVESYRTRGTIVLINQLVDGNTEEINRSFAELVAHNAVIPNSAVRRIRKAYALDGDMRKARASAAEACAYEGTLPEASAENPPHLPAPLTTDHNVLALCAFHKLTDAGKQDFARKVWPEILAIFGID